MWDTLNFKKGENVWNLGHCILRFIWNLGFVIWNLIDLILEVFKSANRD